MNLLAVLIIFGLANEILSKQDHFGIYSNDEDAPLALIKKHDSSQLELAIPQKSVEYYYQYAEYVCDYSEDENGPVQEFIIACPIRSTVKKQREFEEKWKNDHNVSEHTKLYIRGEYKSYSDKCGWKAMPSIEKAQNKDKNGNVQYCGQSGAEIYNVGFPVSNGDASDVQFISIYKICYSLIENEGTLYTVHRIASPSLLLLEEVWEYYELFRINLNKCTLDRSESSENSKFENQYAFEFVGNDDMPTKVWGSTTKFSFNYTPITQNQDAMIGMIKVDNYIRLFSKKTNKPLNLYSGAYETTIDIGLIPCLPGLCKKPTKVNSFWRIIMDDDGLAIMIVTLHSMVKCFDESYICEDGRVMVKEYKKGGCTYTCLVNDEVIERLGLPRHEVMEQLELRPLKIRGILNLTFQRNIQVEGFSQNVSIFEFFEKEISFKDALEKVDPDLASKIKFYTQSTAKSGRKKSKSGEGAGGGGSGGGGGGDSGSSWSFFPFGASAAFSSGGGDYGGGGGGGWD